MIVKTSIYVIAILLLSLMRVQASILTSNSASSLIPNPHCQLFDYKGKCLACMPRFYLYLGYCYTANPYCATYNQTTGACTSCGSHALLEPPLCIIISPTCEGRWAGDCVECAENDILISGFCVRLGSFNLYCSNFTNHTCTNCMDDYYLFNGGCIPSNPLCNTYNMNDGSCRSCHSGYTFVDGKCIFSISLNPYCNQFNQSTCTDCKNGYFLNDNGVCILANPLCATYGSQGECLSCNSGLLDGPLCLDLQNCSSLGTNGKCETCPVGSTPWNSECVSLASLYPFCAVFDGQKCKRCKSGSYLSRGTCLIQNPFCSSYDAKGNCRSCNKGNIFTSSLCLVISPICLTTGIHGECSSCQPEYSLLTGQCVSLASLYPYCASFNTTNCVSCLLGFYLNKGVCTPSNPLCFTYDMNSGVCLSCFSGFGVWGSICIKLEGLNPYCFNFTGISCTACQKGYVMINEICTFANPYCGSYDIVGACLNCTSGYLEGTLCLIVLNCTSMEQNGTCIGCPDGYIPWDQRCVSLQSLNPYCSDFVNGTCVECFYGYYLNGESCALANPFCDTSDQSGYCLSCNPGYTLRGSLCVVISTLFNTSNSTTDSNITCQKGFVLYGKICVAGVTLDPFCLLFNNSVCINCALGYYLENGECIYPSQNCKTFDNLTGTCLSCYPQYFLRNSRCMVGNPLCVLYNSNGTCTNCFMTYSLVGTVCVSQFSINPFCLSFNGSSCLACQKRYYTNTIGVCTAVNPICNLFNTSNGNCLSCYQSYGVKNGTCISLTIINPYCKNFNGEICTYCSNNFYLGIDNICITVNPLCNLYNMTNGLCITCIYGYMFLNATCKDLKIIFPNCVTFAGVNCLKCQIGFYIGANKRCLPVNYLCAKATYDARGNCLTCISGYMVYNGTCQLLTLINPKCLSFNGIICLDCSTGYYIGPLSICIQVSNLCKTYNMSTGNCLTCFTGYSVLGSICYLLPVIDPNCLNPNGLLCADCINGYYLSPTYACTPVNKLCDTYYMNNGSCITCVTKYSISNGLCESWISLNPNCTNFSNTGTCQNCNNGYYIGPKSICTLVSSLCNAYNMTTGACLSCNSEYSISGSTCVKSTTTTPVSNPYCLKYVGVDCTQCQNRYYVGSGGMCTAVNPACNSYNMQTGFCFTCYQGRIPSAGTCK